MEYATLWYELKMLQKLSLIHIYATKDEQNILSRYVGWGGLADAFDESKSNWANEYLELKSLMSEEEYKLSLIHILEKKSKELSLH